MPQFFIDVTDGAQVFHDEVGSEVRELPDARAEAVATLVDLFRHGLAEVDERTASASVRDAGGAIVFRAVLSFRTELG